MSRQLEQVLENRRAKRDKNLVAAVEYGLEAGVARAGGELSGFAYKNRPADALLIVKAEFPGGPQVAFVGAENLGDCLIKATREASQDTLRWREDRYGGQSEGDS